MTKISEYITMFESMSEHDEIDSYFADPYILRKVSDLKIMLSVIGDVDLSFDYIKVFLFHLYKVPYKTSYRDICEKIQIMYSLSKDRELSKRKLDILFRLYQHGVYKTMFKEIEQALDSDDDLYSSLSSIVGEGLKYGKAESAKLDVLKEVYSSSFIKRIQDIAERELISYEDVISILPSKDFIDSSVVRIPLGYDITSAEDLVVKRLGQIEIEEGYQSSLPEDKIRLGYCSTGDDVYTSFTKEEYEKDLSLKRERS